MSDTVQVTLFMDYVAGKVGRRVSACSCSPVENPCCVHDLASWSHGLIKIAETLPDVEKSNLLPIPFSRWLAVFVSSYVVDVCVNTDWKSAFEGGDETRSDKLYFRRKILKAIEAWVAAPCFRSAIEVMNQWSQAQLVREVSGWVTESVRCVAYSSGAHSAKELYAQAFKECLVKSSSVIGSDNVRSYVDAAAMMAISEAGLIS